MRPALRSALLPALLVLASPLRAQEALAGTWEGLLDEGGASIRTVLHLALDAEGRLAGTVDSPEQDAFGLEVADLLLAGDALAFRVPETQGAWEGHLEEGRLVGTWRQRGAELELVLERVEVDPLVGTWEGVGDFGPLRLRIRFHVGTREDGSLGASLVSPDQSPAHVPVASVEVGEDGTVRFDIPSLGASYEGRVDDAAARIEGRFSQSGASFPLDLASIGVPVARKRPQTPEPPFPYREEEVSYPNPAAGNRLAGTLTLPEQGAPFPAVILISGSGQQDRNEEIFGHKPFLVLADRLTRAGIAVLRVDDRGVGGSTGDVAGATSEDFAGDVAAGIDFLSARDDVRADRIGLVGHSEGGLIAPLVATRRDDVAFVVLLAGPGVSGAEILFDQAELLARAAGATDAFVEGNRAQQERIFAILRETADPALARQRLREVLDDDAAALAQLDQVASPWFRYFVLHDPAPILRELACPVLALNGELDLQVPCERNLAAIRAALEAGGNPDFEVRAYPGLNHLFQHAATGAVAEYGEIEETIAPQALDDVTNWIRARVAGEDPAQDAPPEPR